MKRRLAAALVVLGVVVAACGSDDGGSGAATTTGADTIGTAVPGTTADTVGDDAAFPVTIEHKFGSTTIESEPQRVVSIGYNEADFLLALGVTPIALRDWYGDQPNGVWPWAQDELGDATPVVLPSGDLNFEQIAALDPDLIVGVWSGITEQDYELLSAIAPTVAQTDDYADFGTPWQEQTMMLGEATGRTEQARQVVADLDERFAEIRDEHPEWTGQSASVAFVFDGVGPGAYTSQDTRSRLLADLGFEIPAVNDSAGADAFYSTFSAEDLSPLDVDVLVWVLGSEEALGQILALPTRTSLQAHQEGREVFADLELTGAFSFGSPLSIDFALDRLVPEIEAAADGDPSTPVPSAVAVGAAPDAGAAAAGANEPDDQATAAALAWDTVFDSTVAFDEKAPFLADADALRSTVEAYAAAGDGFGGITLAPTATEVAGTSATITYDVNFGPNPAYSDQTGTIDLVDGTWTVSRAEFCSFMASARVPCP